MTERISLNMSINKKMKKYIKYQKCANESCANQVFFLFLSAFSTFYTINLVCNHKESCYKKQRWKIFDDTDKCSVFLYSKQVMKQ